MKPPIPAPRSTEPNYDEEMKLPPGRTCADCYAVRFCVGIGCTTADATSCDYWPRRFAEPRRRSSSASAGGTEPAQPAAGKEPNSDSHPGPAPHSPRTVGGAGPGRPEGSPR